MSDNINIWAEITATPRPFNIVPFPKLNPATGESFCDVAIVMMTAEESALVTRDADVKARKLLKEGAAGSLELSLGYEELYKRYTAEGIVFNTVRNVDDIGLRFFPRREDIFKVLTVDEVGILLNHYYTVQIELGPIIAELDSKTAEMWTKRITEGGTQARFFLNSFSLVALNDLILHLVSELQTLRTDKSLLGEQQETSS